ncbi:hypothetical protein JCM10213v2_001786 [Rhodosporidiobolus nylandii]
MWPTLHSLTLRQLPSVRLDHLSIPHLLPWNLSETTLLPHLDLEPLGLQPFVPPPEREEPAWSLELEGWFQIFHPATWVLLGEDEAVDAAYATAVERRMNELESAGEEPEEARLAGAAELRLLRERAFEVLVRRATRFVALYALYAARCAYIAFHRREDSKRSVADILRGAPSGNVDSIPRGPVGRVWPLPCFFEPVPLESIPEGLPTPPARPSVCFLSIPFFVFDSATNYVLPACSLAATEAAEAAEREGMDGNVTDLPSALSMLTKCKPMRGAWQRD